MPSPDQSRIDARVEMLCQQGCRLVRIQIATLEAGGDIPETQDLDPCERALFLAELQQIMAVYGDACRLD